VHQLAYLLTPSENNPAQGTFEVFNAKTGEAILGEKYQDTPYQYKIVGNILALSWRKSSIATNFLHLLLPEHESFNCD
jgi:hypothetical protein